MTEKNTKTKYLSTVDVWAIAFGCIVGWGAFVMPGTTFLPIAGPLGTAVAIIISAALMIVIGRNYSYLMEKRPLEGGVYTFTKEAFGRDHAFLCSWFLSLSYLTVVFLNATALFVVARTLFGKLFQFGLHYQVAGYDIYLGEILVSTIVLVAIGVIFILKKSILRWLQIILALTMIFGVLVITVAACLNFNPRDLIPEFGAGGAASAFTGVMTIVLLSPWAFVGFDITALEIPSFRFPVKNSKRIITLSILCGAFVYTALTIVSTTARPKGFASWADYVANLDNMQGTVAVPTVFAAQSAMGNIGLIVVGIVALAAIITGIIAAYRATSRMLSAMAKDKILFKGFLGNTFSVIFIMLISIVFSFFGRNALDWFIEMTSFGAIVGFGYTSAAAWKLAAKEKNRRVWITGCIGTGISVVFGTAHLISRVADVETMCAESFFLLAIWCLVGFVFYWRTMRKSELSDFKGVAVSTTVLFCLVLYSSIMWFVKSLPLDSNPSDIATVITRKTIVLIILTFIGTIVMLYIQGALRRRHHRVEREKIHAEESNKAKSRFLYSVTHDIRTPMNAIMGYTHLVRQNKNLPEDIQDYTEKIDVSGKHLMSLINDILEMSRIENGKLELHPEKANIRSAVESAYDILKLQMSDKKIAYILDEDNLGDDWAVFDEEHFTRVLLNLLGNAYKFTDIGGEISLSIKSVNKGKTADYEIHVKDNGIGMSPEFAETIFEAFARERNSTVNHIQGTGLGMAITKSIIDNMGGTIDLITAPNKGTEFIIKLNFELCEPIEEPEQESENEKNEIDFSDKTLLLVDDMEINRKMAKMLLENFGFKVETAENGKDAVDKVTSPENKFDAVLMDMRMPVMDGYEATRALRENDNPEIADIPIIAVTANAFAEDVKRAEKVGVSEYISKPIDPDKLKEVLTKIFSE
jgi:signal transduction histidine kinase/CheY-like chemotaxis protein